ncbi:MAG TPA: 30S ribosomal protein S16, partial [Cytophagaceae bacterium]
MAVKIRLARRGRKKLAIYDIVVADSRAPRDGRFIEKLGMYNPNTNPASVLLNEERALTWVMRGALPTDTARTLLSNKGVMLKKHLQIGVLKGAITQEQADKKFAEWLSQKEKSIAGELSSIEQKKAAEKKSRLEAEAKVNQARAEAIKKKAVAAEAAATEAPAEAAAEAPAAEG